MASDFHDELAAQIAPYLPAEGVALVCEAVSVSPDTETGLAEAPHSEAGSLPQRASRRPAPHPQPTSSPGLFAVLGAPLPALWTPVRADMPLDAAALARDLPILRAQADVGVLRVPEPAVSSRLFGDLRVDTGSSGEPGEFEGRWVFLFTRTPCAVRLRGGWVLAGHNGHAALYREVPESSELAPPPLDAWKKDVTLDESLAREAVDGVDLAGLLLRHGRFDVADPVAALLSGEEAPPVRLVRAWLASLGDGAASAIEDELLDEVEALYSAFDGEPERALLLRDLIESRLHVLSLLGAGERLRRYVAGADGSARSRGLDGAAVASSSQRLRAAWLEPEPRWWARP